MLDPENLFPSFHPAMIFSSNAADFLEIRPDVKNFSQQLLRPANKIVCRGRKVLRAVKSKGGYMIINEATRPSSRTLMIFFMLWNLNIMPMKMKGYRIIGFQTRR
jgi:hypothetical protein